MADASAPPPTVAEIVQESAVTPAEIHSAAPDLSIHMLRHIARGTSSGITYAVPLAAAFTALAAQLQGEAARYEEGAQQCLLSWWELHPGPPPTIAEIIRPLGVSARTLTKANPDKLNLHTVSSILRKGKGRLPGSAQAPALAEALRTLAQERRQTATRYEDTAERLRTLYPDRRVFTEAASSGDGTKEDRIVAMARAGVALRAIGRIFNISTPRVVDYVEAYEHRTGEKIPRYGRVFVGGAATNTRFATLDLEAAVRAFIGDTGKAKVAEIVKGLREGGFRSTGANLRSSVRQTLLRMVDRGEAEKSGAYVKLTDNAEAGIPQYGKPYIESEREGE